MIDKNLFPYNLAAVAIMKNEEPYVKEWLDYHLLAGVNHFFIYDNESTPEFKEILKPYIDADIVTYTFFPGKVKQLAAYHDAIQRFKFDCRYMAFIDGDEFIFPKNKPSITNLLEDIAYKNPDAGGFEMHWIFFGSNGHENADYSQGVLERFTRRALEVATGIKCIVNPRKANYFWTPHFPVYFEGISAMKVSIDELVLNHYYTKSREEWLIKNQRRDAIYNKDGRRNDVLFKSRDQNAEFDDGALKFRDSLKEKLIPNGKDISEIFEKHRPNVNKIVMALNQNLTPTLNPDLPKEFFDGRVETFLTCRQMILRLGEKKIINDDDVNFLLQTAFNALYKALTAKYTVADIRLVVSSLPEILIQSDPFSENIRQLFVTTLSNFQEILQLNIKSETDLKKWKDISDWNYIYRMLKSFDAYEKK